MLGGYTTDISVGEAISVQSQVFHTATSTAAIGAQWLWASLLYDENGAVVVYQLMQLQMAYLDKKVTFTDTVTYPVGKKTYTQLVKSQQLPTYTV